MLAGNWRSKTTQLILLQPTYTVDILGQFEILVGFHLWSKPTGAECVLSQVESFAVVLVEGS